MSRVRQCHTHCVPHIMLDIVNSQSRGGSGWMLIIGIPLRVRTRMRVHVRVTYHV